MGKSFSMSAAWERNEAMIRRMDQEEGHYEGVGKARKKKLGPQGVEYTPNGVLGLDGDHFRIGDQQVSNFKEDRISATEVHAYFIAENGEVYKQRWEQTTENGYTATSRAERTLDY
jgi:hypothetical protein